MRFIINYFIKFPIAANLLIFAFLLLGFFGFKSMKSTFFPEVESRNIAIQVVYPGASPMEIEEGVINKIEDNLKSLTGIEMVTSKSKENSGFINIEIGRSYDADLILQDVKNSVDRISSFPAGMEPLVVYKIEALGFAYSFALSGDVDLGTLKKMARAVEDELMAMPNISKVELTGFPDEEIEIAFRESDLTAFNLTFAQAVTSVRAANLDVTGGTVKGEQEELRIRARNKSYYADGLRNVVVKTNPDGGVVYLHQVAEINDQWSDNPNRTFLDGKPSVVITVQNTIEEDMLTITEEVENFVQLFNTRNEVVKATTIRDGSILLRQRIELLTRNGIQGFLLVLVSLALFLNWRLALWVALSIPISFAGMFLMASYFGITINVLSLFGMIVVIGILVDDGIVVSENIFQRFEKGESPETAALEGTLQVLPSVIAAVLTTVIAFSAFFFIEGRLGDFFSDLAAVVILTLVFSLVEATFTLPTHVSHALHKIKPSKVMLHFDNFMAFMRDRLYAPALRFSLRYKWFAVSIMLGFLMITIGAVKGGIIQTTFFPNIDRDDIIISLKMPAGTRDYVTEAVLDDIEKAAWEANKQISKEAFNDEKQAILKIQKNVGPSTFEGTVNISLLDGESRDPLSLLDIVKVIREKVGPVREAELLTFGAQSAFGKPVSVSLVGNNRGELEKAADALKSELNKLADVADVVDNNQAGEQEIILTLTDKAKYLGVQLNDVLSQVRQGFFGGEVQRLQRGQDEVRVWVRYAEEDRSDVTQLQRMRIRLANGNTYPLQELANVEFGRGIIEINHLDGKREIRVEADIANAQVSVSDLSSNVKTAIVPAVLSKYPSVTARYEGQSKEQEKSAASMQGILPIILLLMFITIAVTFNSVSQTILLLGTIPFGLIGVAWGHWYSGLPLSLFSFLGIIALIGIMVNDGLVLITTYNQNLKAGMPQSDALYETGLSRFRAIFLTSATTILGLAPLMLEKSTQAKFLIPMAASVSYGLLASTIIVLLLLPAFIMIANRLKAYSLYLWEGVLPEYETIEPAIPGRRQAYVPFVLMAVAVLAIIFVVVSVAFVIAGWIV